MASTFVARPQRLRLPRNVRRRLAGDRVRRAWLLAWLGGSVLGIANGVTRELAYADRLGEAAANHVSVATLIGLLAAHFVALQRRWPLPTLRAALAVGAAWAVLTVVFEFGFGYRVAGKSWAQLAGNYDVPARRLWVLVLAWIAAGAAVTRALRRRATGDV